MQRLNHSMKTDKKQLQEFPAQCDEHFLKVMHCGLLWRLQDELGLHPEGEGHGDLVLCQRQTIKDSCINGVSSMQTLSVWLACLLEVFTITACRKCLPCCAWNGTAWHRALSTNSQMTLMRCQNEGTGATHLFVD